MTDVFKSIGGAAGCRGLAEAFYRRVERDPVLRPFFPGSFRCAVDSLSAFLTQITGGPCEYSKQRWSLSLREAHQRFKIGGPERDAWMKNMIATFEDMHLSADARARLTDLFGEISAHLIDQREPSTSSPFWAIEEAVAAIRRGDEQRAIALIEDPTMTPHLERDRGALLSLLAMMSRPMTAYVAKRLEADPKIAQERYVYGATLLHGVSTEGSAEIAELLIKLGADPNAADRFGHVPLYFASTAAVVRALVHGGANVNARDKIQRCTPLHMAARRGNVEVAQALIECAADTTARDKRGDTPLDRARNCRKKDVTALLVCYKS